MHHTERRYWLNGWDNRPGFWSYAFHIGRIGVMLCKPSRNVPLVNLYVLD